MNVTCPRCGAVNVAGSSQCNVCGNKLPSQSLPQTASPTSLMPAGATRYVSPANASLVLPDGSMMPLSMVTVIGRDVQSCTIAFPNDDRLSRMHARLEERNGQWVATDMDSTNGTWVNGARITAPTMLRHGDFLGVGNATFVVSVAGAGASTMMTPPPPLPQAIIPAPPVMPMMPPQQWGALSPQQPMIHWRTWTHPPSVEGFVRYVSERYSMNKDDLLARGLTAAALALIISPALAFLPFIHGNDISARDLRIEDRNAPRRLINVQVLGDMIGGIAQGDAVAVWGQVQQESLILMHSAYNYTTSAEIKIRKT